ncbi:MAG: hypothetical protein ABIF77_00045 [bacterium]
MLPAMVLPEGLLSREQQIQNQLPDGYHHVAYEPALLGVAGQRRREVVDITERETRVEVEPGFVVRQVTFDPDRRLLWRVAE